MKKILTLLVLAAIFVAGRAGAKPIEIKTNEGGTRVTFMSPTIVRVEHGKTLDREGQKSLVVTMQPQADKFFYTHITNTSSIVCFYIIVF